MKEEANNKIMFSIDHFQKKTTLVISDKFIDHSVFFYLRI